MIEWLKKKFYKRRARKVSNYYDKWSAKFLEITDTFQGFRTEDIVATHSYTIEKAGLKNSMKILDAGCGVGGPAFYFASQLQSRIFPLTNSQVQVEIMNGRKEKENKTNIFPILGDYHEITLLFPPETFDAVLFLESLGHSYFPEKVIQESFKVLKPGGVLYIRDHFIVAGKTAAEEEQIKRLTKYADETYVYNHTHLPRIEAALKNAGLRIDLLQKPQLHFFNINPEFEKRFKIKSPNGYFIDTIEIRAVKP